ncbi:unnamed protein product [Spirodela intermedia]|uniref:Uncharacterized protein n=1 Tax=Spirodela intermedia TaxID=51605 RepID=A0A7I8LH10_SPIIN|nr:unnamed protein product [Spirodela intermedia]
MESSTSQNRFTYFSNNNETSNCTIFCLCCCGCVCC